MTAIDSHRTWTDADIAALSSSEIAQLNYDEMLDLISAAPAFDAAQVTESDILVRRVYALRQRCRSKQDCDPPRQ